MHMRLMETFILNRGHLKGTGSCHISLLMNYDQVHVFISARKRKTRLILRFGKVRKKEKLLGILLGGKGVRARSEEHTSELQSRFDLVCRLLLEKKNIIYR